MSKTIVLAAAHTTDRNAWAGLRDTCEQRGVPLTVLGTDKPLNYPSNDPRLFLESVPATLEFLRSTDAEYVVITDSFDVLCARWDAAEIERLCQQAKGNLLVSCEANCFPDGPWRATYDAAESMLRSQYDPREPIPWRYPNAGQYCGTRAAVLAFVERVTKEITRLSCDNPFGGAGQEILHCLFFDGYPMSLDYRCEAFQSMYMDVRKHIGSPFTYVAGRNNEILTSSKVHNFLTGADPLFLHWNGRAPHMDLWYLGLVGKRMPANPMRPEYRMFVEPR